MYSHIFYCLIIYITLNFPFSDFKDKNSNVENYNFELLEVQSYGREEFAEDQIDTLGGPVLGRIGDIEVSGNGFIYVLDSNFKKIAVFKDDGQYHKVITGGYGSGPGEFRLPTALAIDSKNQIWVHDYELQRLTIFDSSGSYLKNLPAPFRTKSFIPFEDTIWATNLAGTHHYLSKIVKGSDKNNYVLPLSDRDTEFGPNGFLGYLSKTGEEQFIMSYERPGVWLSYKNGEFSQHGEELFPSLKANNVQGVWVMPVQTFGIDTIGEQLIVIAWKKKNDPTKLGSGLEGSYLEVFNLDGKRLGRAKIPFPLVSNIETHPQENYIYISVADPYPRVIKYELKKVQS